MHSLASDLNTTAAIFYISCLVISACVGWWLGGRRK